MNERIKSTVSRALPSQRQVSGHLRRAQRRMVQSLKGDKPNDILVQAVLAAAGASLCLSLIRREPFYSVASKLVPLGVFAVAYQKWREASA